MAFHLSFQFFGTLFVMSTDPICISSDDEFEDARDGQAAGSASGRSGDTAGSTGKRRGTRGAGPRAAKMTKTARYILHFLQVDQERDRAYATAGKLEAEAIAADTTRSAAAALPIRQPSIGPVPPCATTTSPRD